MWMKHPQVQRVVGRSRLLRRGAIGLASAIESLSLRGHKRGDTLALIRRSKRGRESLLTANESFTLYGIAHAQAALDGEMAEFGVFEGTSASLIAAAAPGRALHLFDSFAGLPEPRADEREVLQRGQFEASLPRVRARLADLDMVRFHPGAFPASTTGLDALRFYVFMPGTAAYGLGAISTLAKTDLARPLDRITTPLMLISSRGDEVFPVAYEQHLFDQLTCQKRFLLLGDLPHLMILKPPPELIDAVVDWIRVHAPGRWPANPQAAGDSSTSHPSGSN